MNELRVVFGPPTDGAFPVHLESSWGSTGEAPAFTPFLDDEDFADLRWYLEDFMDLPDGGSVVRARRIEGDLAAWGRRLCDALFPAGPNQALLRELLAQPEPRALTLGTDDPRLLRLPWELIADAAGPLTPRLSVRRQLAQPEALVPRAAVLPLRILYIVSRPGDTGFIDPRLTARSLLDALDPLGASVQVTFCRPPTLLRMTELLRAAQNEEDPYDLVHFDGHGTFLPETQLGALFFEQDGDGSGVAKADPVRADRLGTLLANHQIPLVILEACRSATVGETAVFRSVAPRLIQAGVGSVLSMGHAVHVEAARLLLDGFYRELATGTSLGHAVAEARQALVASPRRWIEPGPRGRTIPLQDWFLPHLYQRGLDEPLVPRAAAETGAPRRFDLFLSHNHADSERVERLARLLSEKHGLRVWLDKWHVKPGPLKPQCETGILASRYTVVVGTAAAFASHWVEWEIAKALEHHSGGERLLPLKLEPIDLPPALDELLWVDFRDPARDEESARLLVRHVRSTDAEDARQRRGFRSPAGKDEVGSFPPPPLHGFHGRARELHDLERQLRAHRGLVLHAMGGMGKTTLATEAAQWWTRAGLFPDGACFLSFEQFASAERAVQVLGAYLEGPGFEALPAAEQHRRALELFDEKAVLVVWDNFESVLPQFSAAAGSLAGAPASAGTSKGAGLGASAGTGEDAGETEPQYEGPQYAVYSGDERGRLFELFRELTAAANGKGRLLVTCRPGDTGLPGARKTELHGLARPDSLWLLSRVIAKEGLTLDDPRLAKEKLDPLLEALADHPLSIELVAPHLKALTPEAILADFGKLLAEFQRGAGVERNESLLASLAFSTRRLSPAAQAALPWLGLFRGGVFEDILLDVSEMEPQAWDAARAELEATALVRVEREIQLAGRPYLRFHPTLVYAAAGQPLPGLDDVRKRFIGVYLGVMGAVDQALRGSNPRGGMEVMGREEANFRAAVRWTAEDREYAVVSAMGATFRDYLERSGRFRERGAWVNWLADEVRKGGFSEALVDRELDEAWMLFTQGRGGEALQRLESLLKRLRVTTEFEPAFKIAQTQGVLGRVLDASGLSEQAIPVLEAAVGQWKVLVERAITGQAEAERSNLSATLGDLANALSAAGRLDEALNAAESGLQMDRELGHDRDVAASLGQCARTLMAQGRFTEADSRYEEAATAERRAGDKELEGAFLQHQGGLADDLRQYGRATDLYKRALKLFQEMNADDGVMQTCNLLGVVEQQQGRLSEARTWYERSREIAVLLEDVVSQAVAAQNLGIVCQKEGEDARQQGREAEARVRFEEAKRFVAESLRLEQGRSNQPGTADSFGQLARLYLLLDDLDEAERHAHQAREIRERLGLKEAWTDYDTLADIAHTRGDEIQASEWERKRDAKLEELDRLARGPGGLPPQFLQAVQALAMACAQAGFGGEELNPEVEAALAQLDQQPAPLSDLAVFLRRLAAGELPAVPGSLPAELQSLLDQFLAAVREAVEKGGSE